MRKTSEEKIKNFWLLGILAVILGVGVLASVGAFVFNFGSQRLTLKNGANGAGSGVEISSSLSGNAGELDLLSEDELWNKAYRYEISNAVGGGFSIVGYMENDNADADDSDLADSEERSYSLSGDVGVGFGEIMDLIDDDRAINKDDINPMYADAVINFKDVTYSGNAYLKFCNGYYVLSGSLDCLSYSIFGLIYINNANIMIDNATFSNNGASVSYLVRSFGESNISINNSKLSCSAVVVSSFGNVHMSVGNSEIVSTGASAIAVVGNDVSRAFVSGTSSVIEGAEVGGGALYIEKCKADIWRGNFKNAVGYGIKVNGGELLLSGTPVIEGKDADIWTNETISASSGDSMYLGAEVRVLYEMVANASAGEGGSGSVLENGRVRVVKGVNNYNAHLFKCVIEAYDFHRLDTDLFMEKYYCIKYNSNLSDATKEVEEKINSSLPIDSNHYFMNDRIYLKFLEGSIRLSYSFKGWSKDKDSVSAVYDSANNFIVVANEDIEVFAIWEPVSYRIYYEGVLDATVNDNPSTYTTVDRVVLKEPIKQYYRFVGWTYEGVTDPVKEVVIEKGSSGVKVFTAKFEIATYRINYHNITESEVSMLYKKTAYSINDDSYKLNLSEFMVGGYSVFGIYYDKEMTLSCDGDVLHFRLSELAQNSVAFRQSGNAIGKDIDIYIDARRFYNGEGEGTADSPYIVDEAVQFANLLSGLKVKNKNIYLAFNKDIDLGSATVGEITSVLSNIEIDGRGHTLKVGELNSFGGYSAVIPYASNVVVKNLVLESDGVVVKRNYNGGSIKIGTLIGLGQGVKLQDIQNRVNLKVITYEIGGAIISHYVSNLVCKLGGNCNVVDNVSSFGSVEVVLNDGRNVECYVSAYVADASNAVIVNCVNNGEIRVYSNVAPNYQTMIYAGVMANLNDGSCVLNSINYADLKVKQLSDCWAVVSGVANVIGNGAMINNVANCGNVEVLNGQGKAFDRGFNSSIYFSGDLECSVKNAYSSIDNKAYIYDSNKKAFVKAESGAIRLVSDKELTGGGLIKLLNANIKEINELLASLNEKVESNISETNKVVNNGGNFLFSFDDPLDYVTYSDIVANKWFVSAENGLPTQEKTLIVKFNFGGVLDNYQRVYSVSELNGDLNSIFDKYFPLSYKKHFFIGWYMDDKFETQADLSDFSGESVTLYAKWEALSDRVNNCMLIVVILEILILAVIVLMIYLIDKKKPVTFIVNGKIVEQKDYARLKEISKPTENCTGEIWFMDECGKKVFTSWKMPYYPLNLWQFESGVQKRKEKEYKDRLHFEQMAKAELEAMDKQIVEKQKEQARLSKEQKEKDKIEREKVKLEKQVKKESKKAVKLSEKQQKAEEKIKENANINVNHFNDNNDANIEIGKKNKKTAKNAENLNEIKSSFQTIDETLKSGKRSKKEAKESENGGNAKQLKKDAKTNVVKQPKSKAKAKTKVDTDLDSNITIIQKEIKVRKNEDSNKEN